MNKNIKCALAVLFAMAGLASCSESDYEYTAASAVEGSQVYFPTSNSSTVELDGREGTFTLPIARVDSTSAITVPLTVTTTSDCYTVPQSVAFEAGKGTAEINVSYTGLEYDLMDTITIALPEGVTTPYGLSEYTFCVGCPAPWTEWCNSKAQWVSLGMDAEDWPLGDMDNVTCTYTYVNYWSGEDKGLSIYYRQSTIDATQAQFKVLNWGAGTDLVIEYNPETSNCQILPQYVVDNSKYGAVNIMDLPNLNPEKYTYQNFPCYYDKEAGLFTLCNAYAVSTGAWGGSAEYIQVDGFYIPDYSLTAGYEGVLTVSSGDVFALLNVTAIGPDVTSAKAVVVNKEDDDNAVADALVAGDLEGVDLVLGSNKLALDDMTGELKVVIVAIADEEVKTLKSFNFSYYSGGDDANPWKSIGTGKYSDDIISTMFTSITECPVYDVEIKENKNNPGLYRIMNPYGKDVFPYYDALVASGYELPESEMYLEVNACDPENVYIESQSLGVNLGDGVIGFVSYGAALFAYGYTVDQLSGYLGTLENGVITFPAFYRDEEKTAIFQGYATYDGEIGSYVGMNGGIEITLPGAEQPAEMKARMAKKHSPMGSFRLGKSFKMDGKRLVSPMPKKNL